MVVIGDIWSLAGYTPDRLARQSIACGKKPGEAGRPVEIRAALPPYSWRQLLHTGLYSPSPRELHPEGIPRTSPHALGGEKSAGASCS